MFSIFNLFKNKKNIQTPAKGHYVVVRPKAYEAAKTNRLTWSWNTYKYTADQIVYKFLKPLVARSCNEYMNDPHAVKFLSLLENNVIGDKGISLQAQAKDQNGELDTKANEAHEKAWKEWQKAKYCDVKQQQNFISLCKLAIKTCAREGECLIRIIKGRNAGAWGFALQLIDPRRLDIDKNDVSIQPNGSFVRFGIEFSSYGKPLKYYIKKYDDDLLNQTYGEPYDIIPADEIIHLFLPQFIDQKRGIPWFSPVLMHMNMLNGFEVAAVEHARAGACQMGFITNNDPEAYDEDENNEDIDIEASPASFQQLPAGYDVKKFDPNYPNGEFDVFNKAILRDIAAGLCTGYAELTGDLTSVNFSSLRHGVIETREVWKGLQEWFKSLVIERIHEEWLKYSLLASKIKCGNGYLKPERIDKYKEVTWTMRRWMWVDPVKDVNSASISVQNGFRSRSDVIREQGRDPDEVWEEIQKENDILRAKGILVKDEVIKDVGDNPEEQTDK